LPGSGGVTVPLNFSVPVGTDLHLAQGAGSISMFRNDGGVTYPYTLPGYASITNSAAGNLLTTISSTTGPSPLLVLVLEFL
jgi:hypothetical protein